VRHCSRARSRSRSWLWRRPGPAHPAEPTTLSIVSGDDQTLDTGETSGALTVQVLDQNSDPMADVTVTFTGSGVEHTLSGQSATTGSNGQASVTVTAGAPQARFRWKLPFPGSAVTFTLQVEAVLTATSLTIVSGDGQSLDLEEVSEALVVEVLDQNDDPMEGVTVTFTGTGADHTLSAGTAETGADGRAEVTVTAGTAEGAIEVEAAVAGLAVVFTLTVEQVLAPTTITVVSGDAQSLDFNEVSAALVVEVLDQNNDPIEGVTVTFAGSGVAHTLSADSVDTGADGRAQITVTAGVVDGAIEVEASAAELTPVVFGLTVVDGPFSVTAPDNVRGITFDGTWLWAVGGLMRLRSSTNSMPRTDRCSSPSTRRRRTTGGWPGTVEPLVLFPRHRDHLPDRPEQRERAQQLREPGNGAARPHVGRNGPLAQ
jgi:5-hydroxyisourate hydrolase-like protein (transthyretin family)